MDWPSHQKGGCSVKYGVPKMPSHHRTRYNRSTKSTKLLGRGSLGYDELCPGNSELKQVHDVFVNTGRHC